MDNHPPRWLTAALVLVCGALLLNGGLAYVNVSRLAASEQWVSHTLQVRDALSDADAALATAGVTAGAYVLTGEHALLSQYRSAVAGLRGALDTVGLLTTDNAPQQGRVSRANGEAARAIAAFERTIASPDKLAPGTVFARVEGLAPDPTAPLRATVAEMRRDENALLEQRRDEAQAVLRTTLACLFLFTVAPIVLAFLAVRVVRREGAHRARYERELFTTNQMLRSVLDTIPQRVFWKDRESRFIGANRLFARDAGFETPEQIIGKSDRETVFRAHADAYRTDDLAVMEGQMERLGYEEPVTRPDGSAGWLLTSKVPLRDPDGSVVGVLGTYHDITARKAFERTLERQANFDALTGLPNRNLLSDRIDHAIEHARRTSGSVAVAVIDLDNFKLANDGHGHAFGDRLLAEVAHRLCEAVRAEDTVARYGGDEFVVVLSCEPDERFVTVLERVLAAMTHPFETDAGSFFCTCSIGVSTFPDDGADTPTLLRHADAALYRAKDAGRNRIEVFEAEMASRIRERISIEQGLRVALQEGQLVLHYQPQLNLKTGLIHGVEALVRWNHPERGLVAPGDFIAIAEQSGLIIPMGAWILRTACAQAKAWNDRGLGPLSVAVNLSALQFRQKGFLQFVAEVLEETGLPHDCLELEITESLLMSEGSEAVGLVGELSAMGICLSIDDFGTGYSSLSYLKRLPLDKLKIDQSFVRGIPDDADDAAIARAIVSLARSLELHVVAEGVETQAQCEFMRALGCDEIQGYYFSRPVDATDLERTLASHGRGRPASGAAG